MLTVGGVIRKIYLGPLRESIRVPFRDGMAAYLGKCPRQGSKEKIRAL